MWRADQDKRPLVFIIGTVAVLIILLLVYRGSNTPAEVPEQADAVNQTSASPSPAPASSVAP